MVFEVCLCVCLYLFVCVKKGSFITITTASTASTHLPRLLNMASRESAEEILTIFVRLCGDEVLEDGEDADFTDSSRLGGSGVISEDETSGVSITSSLPDPLYLGEGK